MSTGKEKLAEVLNIHVEEAKNIMQSFFGMFIRSCMRHRTAEIGIIYVSCMVTFSFSWDFKRDAYDRTKLFSSRGKERGGDT